ncbi:MAG TPA: transcriptional regulator [Chitinophagales bacterium]|nr:transcriptional regulator [Chitinophagales bacterium]
MKDLIDKLNKSFENRVRLGIMSALMVNESVDFLTLKELLDVTDGNLASHITALEKIDYIAIKKEFVGKKTKTSYVATSLGRKEFIMHLNALEKLVKQNKQ